ncbi:amidohydrolase family protein [Aurantiacibacter gilvus]|uniref:Amidohydrolase family protein n=1 Tax=Aurantiacibacter gilvus TaxID=3139141 RepID=A0ABU9IFI5_9SPHN
MIIDCHGHVSAPVQLWAYKANILAHRGAHGRGGVKVTDEEIVEAAHRKEAFPKGHVASIKENGIDLQLISPRPFQMMHSATPARVVHWFCEETNIIIHRQCQLLPDLFVPIAGLPQAAGEPIEMVFDELERIAKLGFKGVLLNPDPYENSGIEPPGLNERYWYPLYEKLCELGLPAHVHASGSHSDRVPYSLHFINEESNAVFALCNSTVLEDFPDLKIVISHGGGAIPYQLERFEASTVNRPIRFSDRMRKLFFDTVLYGERSLRLLVETVGADRCLFGSECPGVASAIDPRTDRPMDDVAGIIRRVDWLSENERHAILEGNARAVFGLPESS